MCVHAPQAESDPRAINMAGDGSGLNADTLAALYLPPELRERQQAAAAAEGGAGAGAMQLGTASVRGTMQV